MIDKFYGLTFCHLRTIKFHLKFFSNSSPVLLKRLYCTGKFGRRKYLLSEESLRELREKYGYEDRQFEELTVDKFKSLIEDDETAKNSSTDNL